MVTAPNVSARALAAGVKPHWSSEVSDSVIETGEVVVVLRVVTEYSPLVVAPLSRMVNASFSATASLRTEALMSRWS